MTKPEPYQHGTANRYRNLGCRCDLCRAAWTVYNRQWRQRHVAKGRCAECGRKTEGAARRCAIHEAAHLAREREAKRRGKRPRR